MTGGAVDLLESERGVVALLLLVASIILVIIGKITGAEWLTYTQWIAGILIASKTITGAIETRRTQSQTIPPATVIKE